MVAEESAANDTRFYPYRRNGIPDRLHSICQCESPGNLNHPGGSPLRKNSRKSRAKQDSLDEFVHRKFWIRHFVARCDFESQAYLCTSNFE
jgi:hypothetical protein